MPDVQVFAKWFWGFNPTMWPIVSFSQDGNRNALLRESRPGDLVLFVGTQTEDTPPDDRGRLLGLAEFGRNEIESAHVLDLKALRPNAFDEHGKLRWPKALPMVRAWRLVNRPRVREVLQRQLPQSARVRAVLLDGTDRAAVLALEREEESIPDVPVLKRLRDLNDACGLDRLLGHGPRHGQARFIVMRTPKRGRMRFGLGHATFGKSATRRTSTLDSPRSISTCPRKSCTKGGV